VKSSAFAYPVASTATMPCGARSATTPGRGCISSTRRAAFATAHPGEGEYERTEADHSSKLLAEAGKSGFARELVSVEARGVEVGADWANLRSPETYLGSEQTENFASPGGTGLGERRVYAVPRASCSTTGRSPATGRCRADRWCRRRRNGRIT